MNVLSLLEELQVLARNGLAYADNPYDEARYQRLLELSCSRYADFLEIPEGKVRARLQQEIGHVTPKVGAEAVIFNEEGLLLLMNRSDGSGWCMPCGWVEPNERPSDAAIREVREETGLEVANMRLVGVFTKTAGPLDNLHTIVSVVHLCDVISGKLALSHEGTKLGYWSLGDVPKWFANHERLAHIAKEMWLSGTTAATSD